MDFFNQKTDLWIKRLTLGEDDEETDNFSKVLRELAGRQVLKVTSVEAVDEASLGSGFDTRPVERLAEDGDQTRPLIGRRMATIDPAFDRHLEEIGQLSMGSHHHQVVILVPDDKPDCFGQLENFVAWPKMV